MEAYADLLHSVLTAYAPGGKALHIVAHSMGGVPGLLLANDPPIPVASFLSAETNLIASDCGLFSRRTAEIPVAVFGEKFLKLLAHCESADDLHLREWARWTRLCHPEAFHAVAVSLVKWSDSGQLLEMFLKLQARKLYLYGQTSLNVEVLGILDDIPARAVDGCGHFLMTEAPEAFNAAVVDLFLSAAS